MNTEDPNNAVDRLAKNRTPGVRPEHELMKKALRDGGGRSKPKEWQLFEVAVSRLEEILRPEGFVFRSPDWLVDRDTGELREVDCSIREPQGEAILSLECRKRRKREDILWIEQLACKKVSLGLAGTIAVSSTGFSKQALLKARKHGIVLRTFSEVLEDEALNEFRQQIQIRHISREARLLELSFETDDNAPNLDDETIAAFTAGIRGDPASAAVFVDTKTSKQFSADQILNTCMLAARSVDPGSNRRKFQFSFPSQTVALGGVPETVYLTKLVVVTEMATSECMVEGLRLHQYAEAHNVLLEVGSANTTTARHGEMHLRFVLMR